MPSLPRTRCSSASSSRSTRCSARASILWTSPDQQIDQPVAQLGGALPAQAGQQRQPHRPGRGAEVRRVHAGGPRPPRGDQLLGGVGEQVGGQPDRTHAPELADLAQQRLQAKLPRVLLQLRQHTRTTTHRTGPILALVLALGLLIAASIPRALAGFVGGVGGAVVDQLLQARDRLLRHR